MSSLPKYYGFTLFDGITRSKSTYLKGNSSRYCTDAQFIRRTAFRSSPERNTKCFLQPYWLGKDLLEKGRSYRIFQKGLLLHFSRGLSLLHSGVTITDTLLAQRYPSFAAFKYGERKKSSQKSLLLKLLSMPKPARNVGSRLSRHQ